MMYGPGTNLGHNSILLMLEAAARFTAQLIGAARQHRWRRVELRRTALRRYVDARSAALARMAWGNGCRAWYVDPHTGEAPTNWPYSTLYYLYKTNSVDFNDYDVRR
jgi:hypothetical protein